MAWASHSWGASNVFILPHFFIFKYTGGLKKWNWPRPVSTSERPWPRLEAAGRTQNEMRTSLRHPTGKSIKGGGSFWSPSFPRFHLCPSPRSGRGRGIPGQPGLCAEQFWAVTVNTDCALGNRSLCFSVYGVCGRAGSLCFTAVTGREGLCTHTWISNCTGKRGVSPAALNLPGLQELIPSTQQTAKGNVTRLRVTSLQLQPCHRLS